MNKNLPEGPIADKAEEVFSSSLHLRCCNKSPVALLASDAFLCFNFFPIPDSGVHLSDELLRFTNRSIVDEAAS